MKCKLIPDPYLADVREWPHTLEGQVDIVDGGWSEGSEQFEQMEKANILSSCTAAAHLELAGGHKIGFSLRGPVLVPQMIWPEEFDKNNFFRVSLAPMNNTGVPTAVEGKMVRLQEYEALKIERRSKYPSPNACE